MRKKHLWCTDCTDWFIDVLNKRIADVGRVLEDEGDK
jgi:hypothetical protein